MPERGQKGKQSERRGEPKHGDKLALGTHIHDTKTSRVRSAKRFWNILQLRADKKHLLPWLHVTENHEAEGSYPINSALSMPGRIGIVRESCATWYNTPRKHTPASTPLESQRKEILFIRDAALPVYYGGLPAWK